MPGNELSTRQRRILTFIRSHVAQKGYPPSVREVAEAVGLVSGSSVAYQLDQLREKGFIRRDPAKPRALTLVNPDARACDRCGCTCRSGGAA